MSDFEDAKLILTPNAYKAGKAYSVKPFDGSGDFTVVRNTTANRRNSSGNLESVAVNVPRLNYPIGGGCPSWLIEPQATNVVRHSENFNNASWQVLTAGTGTLPVITANAETAPDGNLTADRIVFNKGVDTSGGNFSLLRQTGFGVDGVVSIYLKSNTPQQLQISNNDINYNLVSVTSEWTRFDFYNALTTRLSIGLRGGALVSSDVYVWGAQLEQGDLTSYIPTNGTAVTRNADVLTVAPPSGTTEIVETFADNSTNTITTIPTTYQLPSGEIKKVIMT